MIRALTGIDCDRWAEEKARGITIDLGFAHLQTEALQIGFVDVPGHERFLHNALAGLGGIRLVLLVVAADEGVKPQTREHLDICRLLEIPEAVVALTKADVVDDDLLELAQLEIEELLEPTPFAGAPIVPVSAVRGDGVDAVRDALMARALEAEEVDAEGPLRLPIDRAFHLKGLGVVVTGTLGSGRITSGDTVEALSAGQRRETPTRARVRSVQVHGERRDHAEAGERTALQLSGVDLDTVPRGSTLGAPLIFAGSSTLCARLRLLEEAPEPITTWVPVRFHLLANEVVGKLRTLAAPIEPGSEGLVEIRLASPVVAVRGDRWIARRPSPATTLGGGVILDPAWRRRRGKSLAEALTAIVDPAQALVLWVTETGERGCTAEALTARLGQDTAAVRTALDRLVKDGRLLRVDPGRGPHWIAPAISQRVIERGKTLLADFLNQDRLAPGMPKAQFVAGLLPARARPMTEIFLQWLDAAKVLVIQGDLVNQPGRAVKLTGEESDLARDLLREMEGHGLTPPSPGELSLTLATKPQILAGVQRYLIDSGKLVMLPSGLILSARAIEDLRDNLADSGWESFKVAEFKDRFAISRKWAIPLLEHLDSIGATRRVGDQRQIVRREA